MVYYNQADPRWANYPYTSSAHPSATLKTSGCGPTSGAMVISSLVYSILPNTMADLFKNNGFRVSEGTRLDAFIWLANNYNLKVQKTTNLDDAVNCMHRGGMAVASCREGGLFSTEGHIVVLAKMKDADTIVVYDPYLYDGKFNTSSRKGKATVKGNEVYCSMINFINYAKCQAYFCYEKKKEIKPDLQYQVHLENIGWQNIQDASEIAGTTGEGRKLEAIKLFGNNGVNLQYRVHIEEIGWQDWKNNGEVAGTTGQNKAIEAIEIQANKILNAEEHIQDVGWMPHSNGTNIVIGTVGKALRLEAFKISVVG